MRRHACGLLVAALVLTGCARTARPLPTRAAAGPRQDVGRLLDAGCYFCLRDALALIDAGQAAERRFDVLALLASRVRELGIRDEVDWYALAATARRQDDVRGALILALVEQVRQPQGARVFEQPEWAARAARRFRKRHAGADSKPGWIVSAPPSARERAWRHSARPPHSPSAGVAARPVRWPNRP